MSCQKQDSLSNKFSDPLFIKSSGTLIPVVQQLLSASSKTQRINDTRKAIFIGIFSLHSIMKFCIVMYNPIRI